MVYLFSLELLWILKLVNNYRTPAINQRDIYSKIIVLALKFAHKTHKKLIFSLKTLGGDD